MTNKTEEVSEPRESAAEANVRAENAKASMRADRLEGAAKLTAAMRRHPKKMGIGLLVLVVLACGAVGVCRHMVNKNTPNEIVTSSTLMDALNIGELNVARATYDGVAIKEKDGWFDTAVHTSYSATVTAKADLSQISIDDVPGEPDSETGLIKVTIHLPEITLDDPAPADLEFFETGQDDDIGEFYRLCKEDCAAGIKDNQQLMATAEENLENTITALTEPLLSKDKYQIEFIKWEEPTDAEE